VSVFPDLEERRDPGNVYGRIITGNDVEEAALATLRQWAPRYIEEVCRQRGYDPDDYLAEPRGYIVASDFSKWPEDQLPVALVISPGWSGRPRRDGHGRVLATWNLAAGVISSAYDLEHTRRAGLDYVAAFRTLIAQQESLGGLAEGVDFIDESYDVLPFNQTRSLFAAQALLSVTVADTFSYGHGPGGPWGPPPDPPTPIDPTLWPEAERHRIDLQTFRPGQPIELELEPDIEE
jgi:hypothetical protein